MFMFVLRHIIRRSKLKIIGIFQLLLSIGLNRHIITSTISLPKLYSNVGHGNKSELRGASSLLAFLNSVICRKIYWIDSKESLRLAESFCLSAGIPLINLLFES